MDRLLHRLYTDHVRTDDTMPASAITAMFLRMREIDHNTLGVAKGGLLFEQRELDFRVMMQFACETSDRSKSVLWTTKVNVRSEFVRNRTGDANRAANWEAAIRNPSKEAITSAARRMFAYLVEVGYYDDCEVGHDILTCFIGAHREMALVLLAGLQAIWSTLPPDESHTAGYMCVGRNKASLAHINESVAMVAHTFDWTPESYKPAWVFFARQCLQKNRRRAMLQQPGNRRFARNFLLTIKGLSLDLVMLIETF